MSAPVDGAGGGAEATPSLGSVGVAGTGPVVVTADEFPSRTWRAVAVHAAAWGPAVAFVLWRLRATGWAVGMGLVAVAVVVAAAGVAGVGFFASQVGRAWLVARDSGFVAARQRRSGRRVERVNERLRRSAGRRPLLASRGACWTRGRGFLRVSVWAGGCPVGCRPVRDRSFR